MKKSFSLIELLTVISIIAILSAVAFISARSFTPTFQLNNSTKLILNKLRQSQEEAIAIQQRHSLFFDLSTNPISYQLIKINEADGSRTPIETKELAENLQITFEPDKEVKEVIFSSDGAPDWSGKISVALLGNTKKIDISPAGVIKIE